MATGAEGRLAFGPFTLDSADERLVGPEGPVRLGHKAFGVLSQLLAQPGRLLTKDALFDTVWGGAAVSDAALTSVIKELRRALGDETREPRYIESVYGRGYRFLAPVAPAGPADVAGAGTRPDDSRAARAGDEAGRARPAIMTPAPRRRRWAVAAGVVIALSALLAGWWMSRPRPAATGLRLDGFEAVGPGLPPGIAAAVTDDVRAELTALGLPPVGKGGSYRLSGSVRRAGGTLRYAAQLRDAAGGDTIGIVTRDIPADATNGFANVTAEVVSCTLEGLATHPDALEIEARAQWMALCEAVRWSARPGRALDLARRLTQLAPDFAPAWRMLAQATDVIEMVDPANHSPALHAEGLAAVRRAVTLDPGGAEARSVLAALLPPDQAVARERILRQAVAARPERCRCSIQMLGDFLLQTGRIAAAAASYDRGVDQENAAPLALWRAATASYLQGRAEAGDGWMRRLDAAMAGNSNPRVRYAVARWTGRWADAARSVPLESDEERRLVSEAMLAIGASEPTRMARAGRALEAVPLNRDNEQVVLPALVRLGRADAAFAGLERSRRLGGYYAAPGRKPGFATPLLFDPDLRPLFDDPRMAGFLERAGFVAYWRAARVAPDLCRAPGAPPFCRLLT